MKISGNLARKCKLKIEKIKKRMREEA